jgi:hypothetical protein
VFKLVMAAAETWRRLKGSGLAVPVFWLLGVIG